MGEDQKKGKRNGEERGTLIVSKSGAIHIIYNRSRRFSQEPEGVFTVFHNTDTLPLIRANVFGH
jgi:hypothetical protein